MKKYILILISLITLSSCEDVINLDTETVPSQLVVDGWITNQPTAQQIRLTETANYFDNSPAKPVLNATVSVTDNKGRVFVFKDLKNDGFYTWQPASQKDTLGRIGGKYSLNIKFGNEEYRSVSDILRVPKIDSVTYFPEKSSPRNLETSPKEGYAAQFFARDPIGEGDCYWIKCYKNNKYFGKSQNIILAYDGAFSSGAATDGLQFIRPIRQSISPELYLEKDTVRVEIYSVPLIAFYFLNQVRQESNNAGLFATPPTNIVTNIQNVNPNGRKPIGFFGSSAVSRLQVIIDPKKAGLKDGN